MFKGSITALVTPFKGDKLDENAYEKFIGKNNWKMQS